jgi:DNA repair exonuclease SbcCD ATPase subunit
MTRPPLPTLQDLRAEADRLGIRWQPFGVCRRKLSDKIEAELKRRNDRDDREEAIGEWIRIVHGVEPEEGAPEVADKIARMGEQIETLQETLIKRGKKIEALRKSEAAKDRQIEALGQVVRGGERQLAELKAQIAGQEGQLKELVAEMFHLEHARDVARQHAQERGRAMYSGPRKQLDRLGEIERRLAQIEDDDAATGHKFRAAGSAVRAMLDRRDRGK